MNEVKVKDITQYFFLLFPVISLTQKKSRSNNCFNWGQTGRIEIFLIVPVFCFFIVFFDKLWVKDIDEYIRTYFHQPQLVLIEGGFGWVVGITIFFKLFLSGSEEAESQEGEWLNFSAIVLA